MNCLQFPLGSFLKINFPWSKPGGFIAASMLARHVWCGNFTVTLHTHRFEAEGDTGVNSQVHMRPKAHPVCLKAQRFVVILSAHKST